MAITEIPTESKILSGYIPEMAVPEIIKWLNKYNVQLKISRKRTSKLGDFRPAGQKKYHRVSVNHDLNKYHFLLTLVHEFAHLVTWEKYKNRVLPHGKEWKKEFTGLMNQFINPQVFPDELIPHLTKYLSNPTSSTSNNQIIMHLNAYNKGNNQPTLAELDDKSYFRISNGLIFQKLEKARTRFRCRRMDNQKLYLVNSLVCVDVVKYSE